MRPRHTLRSAPTPAPLPSLALVATAVVVASQAACGPSEESDGAAPPSPPVSPTAAFPDSPADGPMPEIGPAPDGYRPTAAGAPSTDVWIGDVSRDGGEVTIRGLVNATDRDGYDNQPAFIPYSGVVLYVAAVDTTQTEVFAYDRGTGLAGRVTQTAGVSEFSPTPIPGQTAFSAIHEVRGKQYLWRYGMDGADLGPIFATVEPVGYHAWADERTAVMFVLGNPPTLQVGDAVSGEVRTVAENPGRSIHRIPGSADVSFVRKVSEDEWWIERLDPETGDASRLVRTRPGREDYAWLPDGQILMGDGSTLYIWPGSGDFTELRSLESEGLAGITRIALNEEGTAIAIVSDR